MQGVVGFLVAAFYFDCYTHLGELIDKMALINCTINYKLYTLLFDVKTFPNYGQKTT